MDNKKIDKYLDKYVHVKYKHCSDEEDVFEASGILHKGYTPPLNKLGGGRDLEYEDGYWVQGLRTKTNRFLGRYLLQIKEMTEEEIDAYEEEQCRWKGIKRRKRK